MKTQQFEHDGMNSPNEVEFARRNEIRSFDTHAPVAAPVADPRRVQLLAFYDLSAEADKLLLIQIAKLHADRNARRG